MAQERSPELARRAGTLFDQPGLFMVRVDKPKVVPAVASLALERPEPARAKPTPGQSARSRSAVSWRVSIRLWRKKICPPRAASRSIARFTRSSS